jgi:hypothetical protein
VCGDPLCSYSKLGGHSFHSCLRAETAVVTDEDDEESEEDSDVEEAEEYTDEDEEDVPDLMRVSDL